MNTKTKNRIEFLQKSLRKNHRQWFHIHPENIVGFRIGKKVINGKKSRNYSIVFQVKNKKEVEKLNELERIPPFLLIKFPDEKVHKIKTDVEQTGKPRFQLGECKKPRKNGTTEIGTIGVILKDDSDHFAVTNYHVAAGDRMLNGEFDFIGEDNKIFVDGQRATFVEGILSDEIDVAFIRLSIIPEDPNLMKDGNLIGGFMDGPLSPVIIGRELTLYSRKMKTGKKAVVENNSAVFYTGFQDLSIEDLIQISPKVTKKGDSGGAVLIDEDILIGIIVGADTIYTYAIPFFKINNFKPLIIA